MKNFWIVACFCSIGILVGVVVFAGVSYRKYDRKYDQKVVDAFQYNLLETDTTLQTEPHTVSELRIDKTKNSASGIKKEIEAETKTEPEYDLTSTIDKAEVNKTEINNTEINNTKTSNTEITTTEIDSITIPSLVLSTSQEETKKEIRLLFGGDIYLSDTFLGAYDTGGIGGILDSEVLGLMTEADIAMMNQEFAFSDRGTPMEDKQYTFRVPPSRVRIFQDMGIDIVSLANNHALDFGTVALEDSFETLNQAGILYVGAGNNLSRAKEMQTITVNGKVIGFLAASRVIPVVEWNAGSNSTGMLTTYSPELLCQAIKENRALCDYLVVFVHWGVERNSYPEDYQFRMGKQYIDAGADAVIGCHPHVMQGMEYYKGKLVAYSLGNYIFNLRGDSTALLQLILEESGEVTAELIPVRTNTLPFRLLNKEEKKEFFQYIENISFQISIDEDGRIRYNE